MNTRSLLDEILRALSSQDTSGIKKAIQNSAGTDLSAYSQDLLPVLLYLANNIWGEKELFAHLIERNHVQLDLATFFQIAKSSWNNKVLNGVELHFNDPAEQLKQLIREYGEEHGIDEAVKFFPILLKDKLAFLYEFIIPPVYNTESKNLMLHHYEYKGYPKLKEYDYRKIVNATITSLFESGIPEKEAAELLNKYLSHPYLDNEIIGQFLHYLIPSASQKYFEDALKNTSNKSDFFWKNDDTNYVGLVRIMCDAGLQLEAQMLLKILIQKGELKREFLLSNFTNFFTYSRFENKADIANLLLLSQDKLEIQQFSEAFYAKFDQIIQNPYSEENQITKTVKQLNDKFNLPASHIFTTICKLFLLNLSTDAHFLLIASKNEQSFEFEKLKAWLPALVYAGADETFFQILDTVIDQEKCNESFINDNLLIDIIDQAEGPYHQNRTALEWLKHHVTLPLATLNTLCEKNHWIFLMVYFRDIRLDNADNLIHLLCHAISKNSYSGRWNTNIVKFSAESLLNTIQSPSELRIAVTELLKAIYAKVQTNKRTGLFRHLDHGPEIAWQELLFYFDKVGVNLLKRLEEQTPLPRLDNLAVRNIA